MAEYSAVAVQTVQPGETIVFTDSPVPCTRGLIRHRVNTGSFLLSGAVLRRPCGCPASRNANYFCDFGANIAIPTGGTVGPISVAFSIDGSTDAGTQMIVTPAAVEEYANVSRAANVQIWSGCCETFSIRNTSDQPILVQNANVVLTRPDLVVTR